MARRGGLVVAAVAVLAAMAAACGSSNSNAAAKADATAACQAMGRSGGNLDHVTLSVSDRLTGAALLGVAAAGEDPNAYGNLSAPMRKVNADIQSLTLNRLGGDVKAAVAACKKDKLPT